MVVLSTPALPAKERYELKGGSARSFTLNENDALILRDAEGDQPCVVCATDHQALSAFQSLDDQAKVGKVAFDLNSLHHSAFTQQVSNAGESPEAFYALSLFPENAPANASVTLTATTTFTCIVVVPGQDMVVDEHHPSTSIQVQIQRAKAVQPPLPEPLAEPLQNFRVLQSTAQAYRVKAGEYIQIIDVEGQQCTDFQAFAESDLAHDEALGISPTVTRTFMGSSYPMPGVHSKFYNINSKPLVEIVQDTVGRHDTFGLACNAKYYEDAGYPGHANCTDNFNAALVEYDIPSRPNWETVNLFFNTHVEDCETISADVSWSKAGDYVLFKALTDLVCVSSACPDDIDPANAYNPTDIHVRVYSAQNTFHPKSIFRPTAESIPMTTKETGFHAIFAQHTRNFIEYNGYWLANDFTNYGALKEYWACRQGAALMDLSPLRKFEIYGEDAETLMQHVLTRNVRKLAVGQVVYSAICYENGGMIDDGTLFRMCQNNFRWICGTDYCGEWLRELAQKLSLDVRIKSSTDQLHNVALQGPKSRDILKKIIWTKPTQPNMDELKWFHFSIGRIAHETGIPVIVSRTGYTGELGYEIWCHPKDAVAVGQALFEAGEAFELTPLGLEALDILRIEAGLIFAGYEFSDQTDPFEAGIGFTVPLKSKEDDFMGKTALIQRKASPQHKLVGLELEGNEVAEHDDGVFQGRQQIGVITSGTRAPILNKNIALCRVSAAHSELGQPLEVGKLDGHQKRLPAKIVSFPFYDPNKERVRM